MQTERETELQRIWSDTFKALGVAGLSDEDAAQQSLSKITFNQRSPERSDSVFKGKQAVRKRLENGQIFSRLKHLGDPEVDKNVEEVRKWLDSQEHDANASTTVSNLLQMMFGPDRFHKFIDSNFPKPDEAKAQVQPQPPKQSMGPEGTTPDNSMDANTPMPGPPMSGMMGQQPQVPQNMVPPQPSNPMPPRPAGAELGMF